MLRIATDIERLQESAPADVVIRYYASSQIWSLFRAALSSDHLVIHFGLREVVFFTTMLRLWPFHRCRITTLDFFAVSRKDNPLVHRFICWSLQRVDRFLVYFKDSSRPQREFGIPADRFVYIPYKVNSIGLIEQTPTSDGAYIFCGGRSRRDFATLFAAVEKLGYPVKVVTSPETELSTHGSTLHALRAPDNVEIITSDPSPGFFVRTMAAARIVVLPLLRSAATQAGIAVYMQAMALGKCVIVSSGLGVSDVLPQDVACIVEAGDVDELRAAIQRLWENDALRREYGQAAGLYAAALGGETQLRERILQALP